VICLQCLYLNLFESLEEWRIVERWSEVTKIVVEVVRQISMSGQHRMVVDSQVRSSHDEGEVTGDATLGMVRDGREEG